ncbi:(Fe-S)-binding protein [Beggiatoa leptomitoformis]|uniref:4Fe-4S dicluster domain-containing protein n=1 Tax=Beggiatoa leptomitoformis TaxID=288004 RepID=A0A2N9YAG2_9GAMM|nr:(Fe-S)-binding protein [Beggiatoa leptomitoformis]ALG67143.1 4Fe-4S dicluster domain-containing protein [Beggiatoa leptomitoformis]AUI67457.1 4Fe-4S dicluster domain-containing protein [Beggiatoa leptomitoformis]
MSTATFERGYNALKNQIDAATAAYLQSCVHCGMCAEACLFYTETQDPKYTPIYKVEPLRKVWEQEYTLLGRLKVILGITKKLTDAELADWQALVYNSCTLCGRCSLVCPVGNDIVSMVRKTREGMVAAGHAPEGLIGASQRAVTIGSPMGLKLPALQAQVKHIEKATGLTIPFDQLGAEYMVLLSSMEIINFPEYLEAIAKIMKHAGKTWTLATEAYEATNSGIQIGSSDIAKQLVSRIVHAAEQLQVQTVISPECGHAYTAIRWEGANLMGRPFHFRVRHILEVLDDLYAQGKLKLTGMETERMTFHDPCQLVRRGGVIEQPRRLMHLVVKDFVEMEDSGKMNWCCGGGGGVGAIEDAAELRTKVFNRKVIQLKNAHVDKLVTACANCRTVMEEGMEEYEMNMPIVGLTEMIAEHLDESAGEPA